MSESSKIRIADVYHMFVRLGDVLGTRFGETKTPRRDCLNRAPTYRTTQRLELAKPVNSLRRRRKCVYVTAGLGRLRRRRLLPLLL